MPEDLLPVGAAQGSQAERTPELACREGAEQEAELKGRVGQVVEMIRHLYEKNHNELSRDKMVDMVRESDFWAGEVGADADGDPLTPNASAAAGENRMERQVNALARWTAWSSS